MDQIAQAVRRSGRRHRELSAALGLHPVSFSDRMHGRTRWTITEARALAIELGMSLDDLLIGEDREQVPA